jgi:hypothetical protein
LKEWGWVVIGLGSDSVGLVEYLFPRLNENYLQGKEKAPNDPSPPFKEKEKGGEGRFKAWWPMEGSMLGGQWIIPSLVANGR